MTLPMLPAIEPKDMSLRASVPWFREGFWSMAGMRPSFAMVREAILPSTASVIGIEKFRGTLRVMSRCQVCEAVLSMIERPCRVIG